MTPTAASPVVPEPLGLRDPEARNYLFVGLVSLLVVAAAVLARPTGSLLAALLPTLVGVLGLFTRWSAMPAFLVLILAYFLIAPFGFPIFWIIDEPVRLTHFRILDLVLVGGVIAYLAAQYRLASLTSRAAPDDTPATSRIASESPVTRPAVNVEPGEFGRLFAILAACVLGSQLLWLFVSEFKVEYQRFPPIVINENAGQAARYDDRGGFNPTDSTSRFLLFLGVAGAAAIGAGLVLWYWGLARISPERARMLLLDVLWREHRRELNRQEKWRAWGVSRLRPVVERLRRPWTWNDLGRAAFRVSLLLGVMLLFWIVAFCVLANTL